MVTGSRRSDPRVFAKNLGRLTKMRNLTQKSAAKEISKTQSVRISYSWYRTLCAKGIGQRHKRTWDKLQAIARFFGVRTVYSLWDEDLIRFELSDRLVPPIHAIYSYRLVQLLETGKHDYLKELITRLHDLEPDVDKHDLEVTATPDEDDGTFQHQFTDERASALRRGTSPEEDEDG
jgi:hypothetical protein